MTKRAIAQQQANLRNEIDEVEKMKALALEKKDFEGLYILQMKKTELQNKLNAITMKQQKKEMEEAKKKEKEAKKKEKEAKKKEKEMEKEAKKKEKEMEEQKKEMEEQKKEMEEAKKRMEEEQKKEIEEMEKTIQELQANQDKGSVVAHKTKTTTCWVDSFAVPFHILTSKDEKQRRNWHSTEHTSIPYEACLLCSGVGTLKMAQAHNMTVSDDDLIKPIQILDMGKNLKTLFSKLVNECKTYITLGGCKQTLKQMILEGGRVTSAMLEKFLDMASALFKQHDEITMFEGKNEVYYDVVLNELLRRTCLLYGEGFNTREVRSLATSNRKTTTDKAKARRADAVSIYNKKEWVSFENSISVNTPCEHSLNDRTKSAVSLYILLS